MNIQKNGEFGSSYLLLVPTELVNDYVQQPPTEELFNLLLPQEENFGKIEARRNGTADLNVVPPPGFTVVAMFVNQTEPKVAIVVL